jgi:hypothetical protein
MIRRMPFEQTLFGSYRLHGQAQERALELNLKAQAPELGIFGPKPLTVTGSVFADGLASRAAVTGRVDQRRFSTGAGAYTLDFAADDGRNLRLSLQRSSALGTPLFSFSRFVGQLQSADGNELGRAELRVDLRRTLRRWLVM